MVAIRRLKKILHQILRIFILKVPQLFDELLSMVLMLAIDKEKRANTAKIIGNQHEKSLRITHEAFYSLGVIHARACVKLC